VDSHGGGMKRPAASLLKAGRDAAGFLVGNKSTLAGQMKRACELVT
jgi:hypothetical protein